MPSDRSAVETTTSTPALAPLVLPFAVAVERITVPLGGGLVVFTSAANCSVTLWPATTLLNQLSVPPVGQAPLGRPPQLPFCPVLPAGTVVWLGTCALIV